MDEEFNQNKVMTRFTENLKKIVNDGYNIAKEYNSAEYLPLHIFLSLLENKSELVHEIFERIGIDYNQTVSEVKKEVQKQSKKILGQKTVTLAPSFSKDIKKLLNESFSIALELNSVYVGSEHLLLSFFRIPEIEFVSDIKKLGVTYASLKKQLETLGGANLQRDKNESLHSSNKQDKLPFFVRDMVDEANHFVYPNITGRDKEIKRLIHILSRKTKNNPIIVGDAGVGKTAIVEGFVNRLVSKDVPSSFFDKKVLNLDIASILAGAKLRGDVEERVSYIVNKAIEEGNTIIFIDEIHNIVGAGSVGGKDSLDIANILKPYLTNSGLSVIGATTNNEYMKYFENDAALSRRFQPIYVDELDVESAISVITNLKEEFEDYHNVRISSDAIKQSVVLSQKFIKDRYLPDKAIDLIDEAAASVKIGRELAIEPELSKLGEKLIIIQNKKHNAINSKDYDKAEKYRKQEEELTNEIADIVEGKKNVTKKYTKSVSVDLIKSIIVEWTNIPIVASDISSKTLKNLKINLERRIVGQNHVTKEVSMAIQRSHLGLTESKRPLASFLFLGPTGVGKTELAKTLANELFGSKDLLYQVNMSEYMESHSVSKLIGSPPGYVGYGEGGELTKFVKRKPYSVVLFDEIEKAHPDSLNLLLQILEEGQLVDGKGTKISFSNTIIIMTSNIGAEKVAQDNRLGFDVAIEKEDSPEIEDAFDEMKDRLLEELRFTLRPELLNRIDAIEVFRGLNKEDSLGITRKEVEDLKLQLIQKGLILDVSEDVIKKINDEGYSKEYGGRNIRRKVQEILENGIAEFLLNSKFTVKKNTVINLNATLNKKGEVQFTSKASK